MSVVRYRKGLTAFKLTEAILKKVYDAARVQMNDQDIARVIGIHPGTLIKKKKIFKELREAIELGRAEGLRQVSAALFQNALKRKSVDAQKFILERKGGWKKEVEFSGNPDRPIQVQILLPDNGRPNRVIDAKSDS